MDIAKRIAQMSFAVKRKVGAIAVKDDNILGFGFNGMPAGFNNTCEHTLEDGKLKTNTEVLHAETNLVAKLSRSSLSLEDATVYVTAAPCIKCAVLLSQTRIKQVYFDEYFSNDEGIYLLNKVGIGVSKL